MNAPGEIIYLVDDDPDVLRAVGRLLRSAGHAVQGYSSAAGFMAGYQPDAPGCLVLDVAMPGTNGLDLQDWLVRTGSLLPLVFLSGCDHVPSSVQAMKGGAVDFLTKPADEAELLEAVDAALQRGRVLRNKQSDRAAVHELLNTLTAREREVFDHLLTGQLNKQIAADLGTVEKTIKVHRARVLQKLGVTSIAELVHLAERAR
jgi:FixJ family two-component response regulator